ASAVVEPKWLQETLDIAEKLDIDSYRVELVPAYASLLGRRGGLQFASAALLRIIPLALRLRNAQSLAKLGHALVDLGEATRAREIIAEAQTIATGKGYITALVGVAEGL